MRKMRADGDGGGGGGGYAHVYVLKRWERIALIAVIMLNIGVTFENFWLWCIRGDTLNLYSGFFSACMTLWMLDRTGQCLRTGYIR